MACWRLHLGLPQVADIHRFLPRTQVRSRAETFQANEQIIRKKLKKQLEFWYAKHPPSKRTSFLKDDGNVPGCPDGFGN